jgi:hypothetical protein
MIVGLAVLSLTATAGAAESPKRDVRALENSRDNVAWEAHNAKGVHKQERRDEAQRLQGLIDTLNQGGRVDPAEVDHTLNRTPR